MTPWVESIGAWTTAQAYTRVMAARANPMKRRQWPTRSSSADRPSCPGEGVFVPIEFELCVMGSLVEDVVKSQKGYHQVDAVNDNKELDGAKRDFLTVHGGQSRADRTGQNRHKRRQ